MRAEVHHSNTSRDWAWILGARVTWAAEDTRFDGVVLIKAGLPTTAMLAPRLAGTLAEIEALDWVAETVTSGVLGLHVLRQVTLDGPVRCPPF